MITRYFGLPGCGKTTIAAKIVHDALRSGKWRNVYGNVRIAIPGYTYIPFSWVGQYQLEDAIIIIDEAAIEAGNRDYKSFSKSKIEFFMTHRHYRTHVVLFSQEPDGVDTKIRSITDRMYYIRKGPILGPWISTVYHIPYGLVWPKEQDNGENLGKIVMGYMKPSLFARLFAARIYRPRYYKYFDSWEVKKLDAIPSDAQPVPGNFRDDLWFRDWLSKRAILLRLKKQLTKRQKQEERYRKRSERKKLDEKAHKRLTEPVGINALPKGVKIHA